MALFSGHISLMFFQSRSPRLPVIEVNEVTAIDLGPRSIRSNRALPKTDFDQFDSPLGGCASAQTSSSSIFSARLPLQALTIQTVRNR
jgi:hypothetical protein